MEVSVFIENIQKAFGEKVQLPFAFWYSDKQINDDLKKINGCFFKEFEKLIGGEPISLSADRIGCMGGKLIVRRYRIISHSPNFSLFKD